MHVRLAMSFRRSVLANSIGVRQETERAPKSPVSDGQLNRTGRHGNATGSALLPEESGRFPFRASE